VGEELGFAGRRFKWAFDLLDRSVAARGCAGRKDRTAVIVNASEVADKCREYVHAYSYAYAYTYSLPYEYAHMYIPYKHGMPHDRHAHMHHAHMCMCQTHGHVCVYGCGFAAHACVCRHTAHVQYEYTYVCAY
jgi:hypothetical protein